jgi:hypothetical protein
VLVRSGDPAPGLPGLTLNTASGTGVGGSPREASNGLTLWGSSLFGPGVTTTNDTALFGGFAGGLVLVAREGDPAPGTVGANFGSNINNLSYQPTSVIKNGRVLFQSATVGGDSNSTNNAGWFQRLAGRARACAARGRVARRRPHRRAAREPDERFGPSDHRRVLSTTLGTAGDHGERPDVVDLHAWRQGPARRARR